MVDSDEVYDKFIEVIALGENEVEEEGQWMRQMERLQIARMREGGREKREVKGKDQVKLYVARLDLMIKGCSDKEYP